MNTRMMRSSSFSMPAHDAMWAPEWRRCKCLGFRHENKERCLISVHGYRDVFSTFGASSTFSLTRPHDVSKPCISSIATIILQITRFMVLFSCRGGFWPLSPAVTIPMVPPAPRFPPILFTYITSCQVEEQKKKNVLLWLLALNTPACDSGLLGTIFGQSRLNSISASNMCATNSQQGASVGSFTCTFAPRLHCDLQHSLQGGVVGKLLQIKALKINIYLNPVIGWVFRGNKGWIWRSIYSKRKQMKCIFVDVNHNQISLSMSHSQTSWSFL